MDSLRHYLDTPPVPFLDEALEELEAAITNLDLARIRAARKRLAKEWRNADRKENRA